MFGLKKLEEIIEGYKEVKKYSIERLNTPVFFYYLIALLIWNWDILLIILRSKKNVEYLIELIKNNYSDILRVFFPLIFAFLSSLLFPFLMFLIDIILSYINVWRINATVKIGVANINKNLTVENLIIKQSDVYLDLKNEKEFLENNYKNVIKDLDITNNNLIKDLKSSNSSLEIYKNDSFNSIMKYTSGIMNISAQNIFMDKIIFDSKITENNLDNFESQIFRFFLHFNIIKYHANERILITNKGKNYYDYILKNSKYEDLNKL